MRRSWPGLTALLNPLKLKLVNTKGKCANVTPHGSIKSLFENLSKNILILHSDILQVSKESN